MSVIKSHIVAMSAYTPPLEGRDPKKHLLLDFNERTLPVSKAVEQALVDYIRDGRLQQYPSYGDVVGQIAKYAGVEAGQVMITNGSDQGIELVFRSVCREGDEVIIPEPSFAMYSQCAKIENTNVISPAYTREGGFPTQAVLNAITERTRLIVIANPNNPSGTEAARNDIIEIVKAAPNAAVLVDECYFEYCGASVCDLVAQYSNLIVVRTFSKTWGIPSLRLGYIISDKPNITALLNVRGPYDINQLAVVAIRAALADIDSVRDYVREVMDTSKPLMEKFLDNNNIPYWPSSANFIWIFPTEAEKIELALRERGILVRPKGDIAGNPGLRVTLGTAEQTRKMISVIEAQL